MAVPTADLDRYRLQIGDVLMNEGGDFDKLGAAMSGMADRPVHPPNMCSRLPRRHAGWLNAYTRIVF